MEVTHKVVFDQLPSISFLLLTEHLALNISMLGFLRELTLHTPRQTSSKIKCFWGDKLCQSCFAKEYLLTCQEQACTRFTCFFGWLVVTKPKMAKNTGKCPLVTTSVGETLLQKGPDLERGIIGQVSLLHN